MSLDKFMIPCEPIIVTYRISQLQMSSVVCLFIPSSYPQHLASKLTVFTGFRILSFLNVIELESQYAAFSNGFLHLVTSIYFPLWSFYFYYLFLKVYTISQRLLFIYSVLFPFFLSFFFFFYIILALSPMLHCTSLSLSHPGSLYLPLPYPSIAPTSLPTSSTVSVFSQPDAKRRLIGKDLDARKTVNKSRRG